MSEHRYDVPVVGTNPSTESYWYHFGPQGETRQLTGYFPSIVNSYLYTSWGSPISAYTSVTIPNPFGYGGSVGYYTDSAITAPTAAARRWSAAVVLAGLRAVAEPRPGGVRRRGGFIRLLRR